MNTELKTYLNEVVSAGLEKNYWFMTKQTMTDFYFMLTISKIVETYNTKKKPNENFGTYYTRFFNEDEYLRKTYPKQAISDNTYRNAIISEFFGLFQRERTGYESGVVTDAFKIIDRYVKSPKDVSEYKFLIERQIEKLCLNVNEKIQNYADLSSVVIFPVMFLYKILFELYKRTGDSTLYYDEFVVFLVRAKKYSDWEKTVNLILAYRNEGVDDEARRDFDAIYNDVTATNIRFDTLFGTLSNIEYSKSLTRNYYKIKNSFESLRYIENAILIFEASPYCGDVNPTELRKFLQSDKYFIGNLDVAFVKPQQDEEEKIDIKFLTPEWFNEKGKEFASDDVEAQVLYDAFKEKYAPEKLNSYSNEELLNAMFLGGNADNLCHELEYVKNNTSLFGSVKSGTAFKYPLFKRKGTWMTGTSRNPQELTLDEAIIKGTSVRDGLVNGYNAIQESLPVETVEDYLALYTKLYAIIPELVDSLWVIKYYHMMFPELIPVWYNKDWQVKVLTVLKKEPNDAAYGRLGQINLFVKECDVSNVVFGKVFHKYCRNIDVQEEDEVIEDSSVERLTGGENIILYGVPGAGKSWTIKHEYCEDDSCIERLVFHPDYTYSDFVGQIMPKIGEDGAVSYEFMPGPFTKLVRKAYLNPDKMFYLVIEEVNRGNAPAIFGDIFQLLDRQVQYIQDEEKKLVENPNYGASEYEITNADIARIIYGSENHKVSIPSNMSILCTMNTSDQNVFTLDTAFQRRWNMRLIENKFPDDDSEKEFAKMNILDTEVTWQKFFTEINTLILNKNVRMTSSEDKRLGTHFVSSSDLKFDSYAGGDKELEKKANRQNRRFAEKVLKYLWDDAFKFNKDEIFDISKVNSLEKVITDFVSAKGNERFEKIFKQNIVDALVPQKQ